MLAWGWVIQYDAWHMRVFLLLVGFACFSTVPLHGTDPVQELKSFSNFEEFNLEKLVDGEIYVHTIPSDSSHALSTESCFLLKASPAEASQLWETWDASKHEDLKIFDHHA